MYLGIEIGGTKLQLAMGPGDGTLSASWRGTVEPNDGAVGIRRQIQSAIPDLLRKSDMSIDGVRMAGVGFGGPVDDARGRVITSHQIAGWDGFPLADWLRETFGVPAVIGNDADVAGLGEAMFGAGVGCSPLLYITIGSGIGGGLIIDGEIYRGAGRGAAEIGHLRIASPDGGAPVALEQIASGWAIQRRFRERVGDTNRTGADVARAARAGDGIAVDVLEQAREALAEAICHAIALLGPKRIVLGGGVSMIDEDLWLTPLRDLVAARVFKPFADQYSIETATLGEAVVLHGAIGLATKHTIARGDWVDGEWSI